MIDLVILACVLAAPAECSEHHVPLDPAITQAACDRWSCVDTVRERRAT